MPMPSKSSPSPEDADQAPFVTAFAGLTTLRHLTLEQCGHRARYLPATLRSPLKTVHISFPAYTSWPGRGEWDRDLIRLLGNVANSLEELFGANVRERLRLTDTVPVYPSVRRLSVEMYKHGLVRYPFRLVHHYIVAFPNLTHLSLISEHSDGSFLGCLEVPRLRLTGGISSQTLEHVATILKATRPTHLAVTIVGAIRPDAIAALLRDPFAHQLQTLEVTLCFLIAMENVNVKVPMVCPTFCARRAATRNDMLTVV